jgi:hypothetical protein
MITLKNDIYRNGVINGVLNGPRPLHLDCSLCFLKSIPARMDICTWKNVLKDTVHVSHHWYTGRVKSTSSPISRPAGSIVCECSKSP